MVLTPICRIFFTLLLSRRFPGPFLAFQQVLAQSHIELLYAREIGGMGCG